MSSHLLAAMLLMVSHHQVSDEEVLPRHEAQFLKGIAFPKSEGGRKWRIVKEALKQMFHQTIFAKKLIKARARVPKAHELPKLQYKRLVCQGLLQVAQDCYMKHDRCVCVCVCVQKDPSLPWSFFFFDCGAG